jgi:glucan phosphoethanolaminetransferase (alkaline phosphatase superfamily)
MKAKGSAYFLELLRPDKNPSYLIIYTCIFTLTYSAQEGIFYQKWNIIFYIISFILMINLVLALVPQEIELEGYEKSLRFARALGIMTATVSVIFLEKALTNKQPATGWLFMLIIVQALVFSIFLFITNLKRTTASYIQKKKINNFQLCLITSALLMGIVVNFNYSVKDGHTGNIELTASASIENNASLSKTDDQIINGENKVQNAENLDDPAERHASIVIVLVIGWLICITAWGYQLLKLNMKVYLSSFNE